MAKKLLVAANIHSGAGAVRENLASVIDFCVSRGFAVSVRTSQHPRDLVSYIAEHGGEYGVLLSTGGDGTLNETLNGLMRCPAPPLLAYIPAGTVNDFASSLGIPRDPAKALRLLDEGEPFRCDAGKFGEEYFAYVAAFGAFTDVSYETPQEAKQLLGRFAYIVEGIKRLPTLRAYHMTVEGDDFSLEEDFIFGMASNSTSVAGFRFDSKHGVAMDDGTFEVTLVRAPHNLNERQALLNGIMRQEPVPGLLDFFHTKTLSIRAAEPVRWTLDGEFGGEVAEVEIQNCPQAFTILAPKADAGPQSSPDALPGKESASRT